MKNKYEKLFIFLLYSIQIVLKEIESSFFIVLLWKMCYYNVIEFGLKILIIGGFYMRKFLRKKVFYIISTLAIITGCLFVLFKGGP